MLKHLRQQNKAPQLPRLGKIRLGTPKTERAPGRNTDVFRIDMSFEIEEGQNEEQLKSLFGSEQPKEIKVYFPRAYKHDNEKSLEYVFDANYKMYAGGKLFCVGDGEESKRRGPNPVTGKEEFISREPGMCPCQFLNDDGKGGPAACKQVGELKVLPVALFNAGVYGYMLCTTSSWNAIRTINDRLYYYQSLLGEAFWKTPFIIYKEQMKVRNPVNNKMYNQYILSIKPDSKFLVEHGLAPTIDDVYGIKEEEDGNSHGNNDNDVPVLDDNDPIPEQDNGSTGVQEQHSGSDDDSGDTTSYPGGDYFNSNPPDVQNEPSVEPKSGIPYEGIPDDQLTKGQKAARTRAINKAKKEEATAPYESPTEEGSQGFTDYQNNQPDPSTGVAPQEHVQHEEKISPENTDSRPQLGGDPDSRQNLRVGLAQLYTSFASMMQSSDPDWKSPPEEVFESFGLFTPKRDVWLAKTDYEYLNIFISTDAFQFEELSAVHRNLSGQINQMSSALGEDDIPF